MRSPISKGFFSPLSLRTTLITICVVLVGFSTALTAILSFNNSRQTVNAVSLRLQNEIVLRVKDHLAYFLKKPNDINFINAMAMGDGSLDVNDVSALKHHFWRQVQRSDSVTSIYFGNTAGGLVNAAGKAPPITIM